MMGSRGLKRATLLLFLLYAIVALFIRNTALECDGRGTESQLTITSLASSSDRSPPEYNSAEVVRKFWKAVSRRGAVPVCGHQASANSSSGSVSLLVIGSLELAPASELPGLVREAVKGLPGDADLVVWTLVSPLTSSSSTTDTLSALKSLGVGLVSLATEGMSSSQEERVRSTTHLLEEAGLSWLGLSARRDDVVTVNGLRIGVLTFCAVYRECGDSSSEDVPFAPVKYSPRTATSGVKSLRSRGADVIVVMVRWGRGARVLPDETALVVARFLVSLGVTLIIGDHPVLQQSHAYFEDTLIVFSPGSFCRPSLSLNLCWRQREEGEGLEYSSNEHCQALHPKLRPSLLTSETHTSLYQISLSRSSPAVAEYVSTPLRDGGSGLQLPRPPISESLTWTRVCGMHDLQCLACTSL